MAAVDDLDVAGVAVFRLLHFGWDIRLTVPGAALGPTPLHLLTEFLTPSSGLKGSRLSDFSSSGGLAASRRALLDVCVYRELSGRSAQRPRGDRRLLSSPEPWQQQSTTGMLSSGFVELGVWSNWGWSVRLRTWIRPFFVKYDIKASAGSGVGAAGIIPAVLLGAILPMPADATEGSFRPGVANERAGSRWLLHFHKIKLLMMLLLLVLLLLLLLLLFFFFFFFFCGLWTRDNGDFWEAR